MTQDVFRGETEKQVGAKVRSFYDQLGIVVKSTSQARRSKVALGLPDLFCFWPARQAFWCFELKTPEALHKLSVPPRNPLKPRKKSQTEIEQAAFRKLCESCGVTYLFGGLAEAVAHVEAVRKV